MVVGRKERSKKKEERRKMNAFEMLSDLHGPTYIGFYLMAVAMAAMVAYLVRHYLLDRDKLADRYSESDLAPLAASLDPYEVAYLLGGARESSDCCIGQSLSAHCDRDRLEQSDTQTKCRHCIQKRSPCRVGHHRQISQRPHVWCTAQSESALFLYEYRTQAICSRARPDGWPGRC